MSVIAAPSATADETRTARFVAACLPARRRRDRDDRHVPRGARFGDARRAPKRGDPADALRRPVRRGGHVHVAAAARQPAWAADRRRRLPVRAHCSNASANGGLYPLGRLFFSAFIVWIVYVALCYPRDRLARAPSGGSCERSRWPRPCSGFRAPARREPAERRPVGGLRRHVRRERVQRRPLPGAVRRRRRGRDGPDGPGTDRRRLRARVKGARRAGASARGRTSRCCGRSS